MKNDQKISFQQTSLTTQRKKQLRTEAQMGDRSEDQVLEKNEHFAWSIGK